MPGTPPEPTLRGRDEEVSQLRDVVGRARTGRLSVVMLEGEAGIGKTRLLTETLTSAQDQGCQIAWAKAEEMEQTRPFGLIAEALGCVRSASDPRRAAIAGLLLTHDSGDHGPVTVSSDPGLRFRVVDALCDLAEDLALDRPLVIGVDDLQWADPSSLLTLGALARTAAGLPVALIGCYRPFPHPQGLRRLLDSLQGACFRQLALGRLSDRDVHDVVAEVVDAAPGRTLLAGVAGAAGNPLFLTELLNAIIREGDLHTADGHAEMTGTAESPSLRLTILRRLSSLPEQTLHVLRTGSLLGSSFSVTELAAVLDRRVTDLIPGVEPAIAAGVLRDDGLKLRFRHDLVRDAVYADIPPSLRLGLHREAAHRLADIDAPVLRVAEQFMRGARPGDEQAISWFTRAAREATSGSPETGGEFLQRAVDLMPPTDPRRDALLSERADALMSAGRLTEAIAACRSLLDRDHRPEVDASTRIRLGAALLVNGRPAEALRELDNVVDAPSSTELERTRSLGVASTARLWLGDFDGATRTAEVHSTAVRLSDHRTATAALATQSVVACMRGRIADAIELIDKAIGLADDSPGRVGHAFPLYAPRGWLLMEQDKDSEAEEALDKGRRICEELGVRWPLATYQAYLAVVRFVAGEWDDVLAELEAGIGFAEETGVTYALKPAYSALAVIRLYRNDLPGARQALGSAVALADRGSRLFDYRALWAHALLLEAEGDAVEAYTELSSQWRLCQDAGMAVDYPVVGPDLVRLARRVGDMELAEQVTAAVTEVASRNEVPSFTGAALRCRGLLTDDTEAMMQALDAYAEGPRRLELALTCEEAAALMARGGDGAAARSLLERARHIFERLDATRGLVRVDAALRQLGVRRGRRGPRRRPQWGWESLTPTERAVADLVAEGLSNPQIAERMYISRRTVQTHVGHMFTKLEIGSRSQLAARVAQHGRGPGDGVDLART